MTPDSPRGRGAAAAGLLALTLFAAACGPGNFANTNDDLRRENLRLQREVEQLSVRVHEEIAAQEVLLGRAAGSPGELPAGVRPAVLVKLTMDRYGATADTDGDGFDDVVRLYVYPRDQQGRMLPAAGTLRARAVDLGVDPPAVLGEVTLSPAAFDAAYRDGFTGPYYRVEIPLDALEGLPAGQRPGELTAAVSFEPALGGPALTAQRVFDLDR